MITITIDGWPLTKEFQEDLEDYIRRYVRQQAPEGTAVSFTYPSQDPVVLADAASDALAIVVAALKPLPAEKREKVLNMARKLGS